MRSARSFSADQAMLEDLVQDVYVRLCDGNYKALRGLRGAHANSFHAYVGAIASGVVIDHFRKSLRVKRGGESRTVSLEALTSEIETLTSPENQLETTLMIERIDTCLDEVLPAKTRVRDRWIFWLRYRHGYTVAMIARTGQHGLSEEGIESLLGRTIRLLREKLT